MEILPPLTKKLLQRQRKPAVTIYPVLAGWLCNDGRRKRGQFIWRRKAADLHSQSHLKDAPIILLDEATSSVDPENEWMLQQAIQELTAGKTVVMIAHKIKTIMNAGQIIVMDNGRVHGIGTHEALLQSDEIYRTFWDARRTASQWKI